MKFQIKKILNGIFLIFSYFSPFHCAAENGHSGIIELLLPLSDIDINSKTVFFY